jgi:hypothetical protein
MTIKRFQNSQEDDLASAKAGGFTESFRRLQKTASRAWRRYLGLPTGDSSPAFNRWSVAVFLYNRASAMEFVFAALRSVVYFGGARILFDHPAVADGPGGQGML